MDAQREVQIKAHTCCLECLMSPSKLLLRYRLGCSMVALARLVEVTRFEVPFAESFWPASPRLLESFHRGAEASVRVQFGVFA